jgi:hypothetical protein
MLKHNSDCFFLEQKRISSDGLFYFWIYFAGTAKECDNFVCEIEIGGDATTERHIFEGPPISIDVSFDDAIDSRQGLVFEDVVAKRLLNNGSIKLAVAVKTKV